MVGHQGQRPAVDAGPSRCCAGWLSAAATDAACAAAVPTSGACSPGNTTRPSATWANWPANWARHTACCRCCWCSPLLPFSCLFSFSFLSLAPPLPSPSSPPPSPACMTPGTHPIGRSCPHEWAAALCWPVTSAQALERFCLLQLLLLALLTPPAGYPALFRALRLPFLEDQPPTHQHQHRIIFGDLPHTHFQHASTRTVKRPKCTAWERCFFVR